MVRTIARRRGDAAARPMAVVLALLAMLAACAPIALPPPNQDAAYLSKNVLSVLTVLLPLATALGAMGAAFAPSRAVTPLLAPALALVLAGFGIVRADTTRASRAPFQRLQATIARDTLRRTLEPNSIVITSEDMGRPAENIEYYGGFPAFYVTDLDRWRVKASYASQLLIAAGVRPYLLVDRGVEERGRVLNDLTENGFLVERVADIEPAHKMEYFVASPQPRNIDSELYRISHPKLEEILHNYWNRSAP
jgi:hypothetical protein